MRIKNKIKYNEYRWYGTGTSFFDSFDLLRNRTFVELNKFLKDKRIQRRNRKLFYMKQHHQNMLRQISISDRLKIERLSPPIINLLYVKDVPF